MILHAYHPDPPAGVVTLFPNESGGGVYFDNSFTIAFTAAIGHVYAALTRDFGIEIEREFGIPAGSGAPIARRAIVPLTHCFADRFLRVQAVLGDHDVSGIAQAPPHLHPGTCEQFDYLATQSFAFNQDVLGQIGELFGIPKHHSVAVDPFAQQPKMPAVYNNHLFFFAGSNKLSRGWQRFQLAWSQSRGRVIATWMVNTKIPTLEAGLYGRNKFAHMEDSWSFVEPAPDSGLRERLLIPFAQTHAALLLDLLARFGSKPSVPDAVVVDGFAKFLARYFPSTLLEGAKQNTQIGIDRLRQYPKCVSVYSCGLAQTTQAAFLIAASRITGKKVIGTQHGGHYGYMAAHTAGVDVEYPDCDRYITWGWKSFPDHPALGRAKILPLPAPWYSHRRKQWRKLLSEDQRIGCDKEFDFAFMPNKVYPYIPAPSAAHASINHVSKVADLFEKVITSCSDQGFRVLMKVYGLDTLRLLAKTLANLQRTAGPHLQMNDNLDKGITPRLVKRCNVFLWDQPGTGFIECIHANIPSMVFWPKLYNHESPDAAPIMKAMEDAGLIHRTMTSLLSAYADFRRDPKTWMSDPQRQRASSEFVNRYGWAEDDWPAYWREFLTKAAQF